MTVAGRDSNTGAVTEMRRAYEPPAWEEEEVFEVTANTCAKADAGCAAGPLQS